MNIDNRKLYRTFTRRELLEHKTNFSRFEKRFHSNTFRNHEKVRFKNYHLLKYYGKKLNKIIDRGSIRAYTGVALLNRVNRLWDNNLYNGFKPREIDINLYIYPKTIKDILSD